MARRRGSSLGQVRSILYQLARLLGDIQAVQRGPRAVARRMVRRAVGRTVGRAMWRRLR